MIPGVPNLLLLMLIDSCLLIGSIMCKRSASSDGRAGRKKVVIIGEMSDLAFEMATNASASTNYAVDDVTFADYDDPPHEDMQSPHDNLQPHRFSPSTHSKFHLQGSRTRPRVRPWVGKRTVANSGASMSPGSSFVPVAAYSVTHSRVGPGPNGVRRMRPGMCPLFPRSGEMLLKIISHEGNGMRVRTRVTATVASFITFPVLTLVLPHLLLLCL